MLFIANCKSDFSTNALFCPVTEILSKCLYLLIVSSAASTSLSVNKEQKIKKEKNKQNKRAYIIFFFFDLFTHLFFHSFTHLFCVFFIYRFTTNFYFFSFSSICLFVHFVKQYKRNNTN